MANFDRAIEGWTTFTAILSQTSTDIEPTLLETSLKE